MPIATFCRRYLATGAVAATLTGIALAAEAEFLLDEVVAGVAGNDGRRHRDTQ